MAAEELPCLSSPIQLELTPGCRRVPRVNIRAALKKGQPYLSRPETTIKYAHDIEKEVSETRALHHWHPVLLAETERAPSTCAGVEGEGVEAAGGARAPKAQRPLIPIICILDVC